MIDDGNVYNLVLVLIRMESEMCRDDERWNDNQKCVDAFEAQVGLIAQTIIFIIIILGENSHYCCLHRKDLKRGSLPIDSFNRVEAASLPTTTTTWLS